MKLNDWGEQKQREMFDLWETYFPNHLSGFEVFTSPIHKNASAVIIGYNAGGGDEDATELNRYMERFVADDPDFSLPEEGHYQEGGYDYLVAQRIRNYFFHEKRHLLKDAVETNRYFLRTAGKHHHRSVLREADETTKTTYKAFCRETIREVIQRTNPRVVVDFSGKYFATELCADLNFTSEHRDRFQHTNEKDVQSTVDVADMTEAPNATVVSVKPHPSAPPLAQDHLDFFKQTIPPLLPE